MTSQERTMTSRKNPRKRTDKAGKRFAMFVMPLDEEGLVVESRCGWLKLEPEIEFVPSPDDAMKFVARESGHGSFADWKAFFEEEHPDWKISQRPKWFDD